MMATQRQFVFGTGEIREVTDQSVRIVLTKVVKRLELAPEDEIAETSFAPKDVVAAWHSSTHELKDPGLVGEYWDDSLLISVRGHVVSIAMYRATPFKPKAQAAGY
ncbi:MAG: hypothetical protein ACYC7A_02745 [Thermoanaerobaculia bacterium]